MECEFESRSIELFREYLQIETVQPSPDYDKAIVFLKREAESIGLKFKIIVTNADPKREAVLMTWTGRNPELRSILLNSHIDVVPVFPEFWEHPSFSAHTDDNGNIYARGSQDMKCVGIQYLQAVRKMRKEGISLQRTVHLLFVPDEEIAGLLGMQNLVLMKEFQDLNIAFALDEGLANPSDAFTVFYGERSPWWFKITAKGQTGHGSRFIKDNAAEKLRKIINKFLDFRDEEENRLNCDENLKLGDVTTVNLTKLSGGIQVNIVPSEFIAEFDCRVAPTVDRAKFEKQIVEWCKTVDEDSIEFEFTNKFMGTTSTEINDGNIWWKTFENTFEALGMKFEAEIFPAATDSRFLRSIGIPALGFSPINNTPILLHDHNEYLNKDVFLNGISVYYKLIQAFANV